MNLEQENAPFVRLNFSTFFLYSSNEVLKPKETSRTMFMRIEAAENTEDPMGSTR
jgi:hypothetical protein